ncbi:MAG: 2-polyprenyl-3-methyl-6-methoxy-1,4-benzoquinone monooxygenase [Methylotenera sp.]|nr:2-polyprenyl-3-methyl-6-methoxy-1,4-benzoquinone monooxygenase [Methylotenera sp.]MDP1755682.1 2-polyprenyl-3-methyl-6-methoxy-1,4-benzoquinone monooxygenase [Methylotenera sp.]MDP1960074.1 2-polyprenyl-3-methyl-6-methoxy-1,4-benzoquinone monooxygenase [Methylotenera sp.]MDP3304434.1 2-polyprenyl-3-methyl-6-methoxy-1,4-benzoquinone monooxygenase [Methylotenera sp.]MDP3942089.1 2-polyprenyl-3-methyl-6-methoxy-1,4-benzoquinone monooxygenase [Methylotenera sp.]
MDKLFSIDRLITEFDTGLRTLLAKPHSLRAHPDADTTEATLSDAEKKHVRSLMRINHTGEVCAQALYSGQALTARNAATSKAMQQAAQEETEHLAWCESRIHELGGRTSMLNPLFYIGSFAIGATAGALGDKWSLGFLEETEKQVGAHLASHLKQLPATDEKSHRIIEQMQIDEAKHAQDAKEQGAAALPAPVRFCMKQMSKIMTATTYRL